MRPATLFSFYGRTQLSKKKKHWKIRQPGERFLHELGGEDIDSLSLGLLQIDVKVVAVAYERFQL